MQKVATLDRHKEKKEEQRDQPESTESEASVLATIYGHIDDCRRELSDPLISAATRESYESMFVGYITEKNVDFARTSAGYAADTVARAQSEFELMDAMLASKKGSLLNDADIKEMKDWFRSDGMLDMVRTKTWEQKTKQFIEKHASIAHRRSTLLSRLSGLDEKEAEGIAVLKNEKTFLRLDVAERISLMNKLEALDVAVAGGKKNLFVETSAILRHAATSQERYMHPAATGSMLKKMMTARKPEQYRDQVLLPFLETYRGTRNDFDALQKEIQASDTPPIAAPKLDTFLKWNAERRSSFIAEGRRRLRQNTQEEKQEEDVKDAMKQAESCMRLDDWDAAIALLEESHDRFPEEKNLAVMLAYANDHRADAEEERREQEHGRINAGIDAKLRQVPPALRTMYVAMAMQGPDAFREFTEGMERGAEIQKHEEPDAPADDTPHITQEDDEDEPARDEGDDEEMIAAGETADDQEEAAEELLRSEEPEKAIAVRSIAAETQERYVRHIGEPVLRHLEELQARGERYKAA